MCSAIVGRARRCLRLPAGSAMGVDQIDQRTLNVFWYRPLVERHLGDDMVRSEFGKVGDRELATPASARQSISLTN